MLRAFVLSALLASLAFADTVTYTFSVTASGTLDGTSFEDSLLTITALADTASPGSPYSSTVTVGALSDSFNSFSPYVFVNSGGCSANPESSSCVGFGIFGVGDVLDISNNEFASYVLGTDIGPVTDSEPYAVSSDVSVDGGTLALTSAENATFTASTVPEPSSAALLGIAGIALWIGRRRSQINS